MDIRDHSFGPGIPKHFEVSGIQDAAQQFYNEIFLMPDLVLHLLDAKLHVYSHTESSKIVGFFEIYGTRLYDLPYDLVIPANSVVTHANDVTEVKCTADQFRDGQLLQVHEGVAVHTGIHNFLDRSKMLRQPTPFTLYCRVTLLIDPLGCIERLEFDAVQRSEICQR